MRTSFVNNRDEIDQIIASCDVCFVGMVDIDGMPYVIPMNFGYDGENIILHSGPEGKYLDLLGKDNRVCITFCSQRELRCQHPDVACSYSMESKSVVCKGMVFFIDDNDLVTKERYMNIIMKNYSEREFKYSEPALRNVKVWKVRIDSITGKAFGQNFKSTF
ncbi:pyridoxamine 5'-phosphate oxidase family protein [Paludibacter sp. 221]|uniref:pyridoxamine 5'-phosphate oxidase family protein n=1 Tax=Paludibacter sp. 221 TaxID=2302939 RepID=UPI0013D2F79A|nr:pyridoxamine 5'-phosphate oxidase family protein [Paludibacter sp. 221]NDV46335.1 pyridoxamine 5'-phosphate oxidase family protein [Paludibacter sp. 221]